MANAMVMRIQSPQTINLPNITWRIEVLFLGVDVPAGFKSDQVEFETTNSVTPAQLLSAAVSAIQSKAISLGFTVANGHSLIPTFTLV